jgi:hypothetical protein
MKHIKTFEGFLDGGLSIPYQFNDKRGEDLYKKYYKAFYDKAWDEEDNYKRSIKLDVLLKITGLTVDELVELGENYGDESWELDVDLKTKTVTEYTD